MHLIIAGDIGGTKTNLAQYAYTDQRLHCINQETFSSHDFRQFDDMLMHFMTHSGITRMDVLALSVAGPVINNACRTTNLPWHISGSSLKNSFKATQVILLNDMQATGYGLLNSDKADLIQLNPHAEFETANQAILSIGTGLGEGFLFWDGKQHIPCGTEGGHSDFAPLIESDLTLWLHFKKSFPTHLSYERLLSGPGIALLYDYVCQQHHLENNAPVEAASAWVTTHAIHHTDQVSVECMAIFIRLLAAEAANLYLKIMATGGVYITGGIAPKILPLFTQERFIDHFIEKGRFKDMLKRAPVWVNLSERTPIEGALAQAIKLL